MRINLPGATAGAGHARKVDRPVYVADAGGFVTCPVFDRYRLGAGAIVTGPAIVEERETTVVLLPGDVARVDPYGSLVVDLGSGA